MGESPYNWVPNIEQPNRILDHCPRNSGLFFCWIVNIPVNNRFQKNEYSFFGDPYNGLLQSPHNWVVCHPQLNNHGPFFHFNLDCFFPSCKVSGHLPAPSVAAGARAPPCRAGARRAARSVGDGSNSWWANGGWKFFGDQFQGPTKMLRNAQNMTFHGLKNLLGVKKKCRERRFCSLC